MSVSTSAWLFPAPEIHSYLAGLRLRSELQWKCLQVEKLYRLCSCSLSPENTILAFAICQPGMDFPQTAPAPAPRLPQLKCQVSRLRLPIPSSAITTSPPELSLPNPAVSVLEHLSPPDPSNAASSLYSCNLTDPCSYLFFIYSRIYNFISVHSLHENVNCTGIELSVH